MPRMSGFRKLMSGFSKNTISGLRKGRVVRDHLSPMSRNDNRAREGFRGAAEIIMNMYVPANASNTLNLLLYEYN